MLGGDLAYPSPSYESYEHRLFAPFHDAMSSPKDHSGKLVMHKAAMKDGLFCVAWHVQPLTIGHACCDHRRISLEQTTAAMLCHSGES